MLVWFRGIFGPGQRVLGACGPTISCDSMQFVWGLRWVVHSSFSLHNPFFTDHLDWPRGANGMWQTWTPPLSFLFLPVHLALGPPAAYDATVVLTMVANCLAAQWMLRSNGAGRLAALGGALAFGLSPYFPAHLLGHLNLVAVFCVPLVFETLSAAMEGRPFRVGRRGVLLGGLLALQYYLYPELALTLVVAGALYVACALAVGGRTKRAGLFRLLGAGAVGAPVAALLSLPGLWYQLRGPMRIEGALHPPYGADIGFFIRPTTGQLLGVVASHLPFHALRPSLLSGESDGFFGVLPVVALLVAWLVAKDRKPVAQASLFTALVLVLSAGDHLRVVGVSLPMPWKAVLDLHVPYLGSVLPNRLTLFAYLVLIDCLARMRSFMAPLVPRQRRAAIAVASVSLASLAPSFYLPSYSLPGFAVGHAGLPRGSVVLFVPLPRDRAPGIYLMSLQASEGFSFRMMGGYVLVPGADGRVTAPGGLWPPQSLDLATEEIETRGRPPVVGRPPSPKLARAGFLRWLQDNRVSVVALYPSNSERRELAYLEEVFGRPPKKVGAFLVFKV
jgi:hypothetical protein